MSDKIEYMAQDIAVTVALPRQYGAIFSHCSSVSTVRIIKTSKMRLEIIQKHTKESGGFCEAACSTERAG
ncbi:hypothetical protein [Mesorhizobium sp. M0129]|uniref:hypothetical protein n=1 Tax=Mesorhizobium sp. M0129 TaxID=2956886 RepID=UPI003335E3C5